MMSQAGKPSVDPCNILVIQEDLVKLTSIQESLLSGPEKDVCIQMGATMGEILKNLDTNIASLTNAPQAKNSQNMVAVQDSTQNRGPSPEKKSGWSLPSFPFSKKPKTKVQIMNSTLTQTTKMFISAMVNEMDDYICTILGKNDQFDKQIPLIVVCPNSSRLLPDVELALETIERPFEHVVIIIHTGSEANLPAIPSRKKIRNYKDVTFIDMGYEQHRGIYKCFHNTEAEKTLKSFVKCFYANIKANTAKTKC